MDNYQRDSLSNIGLQMDDEVKQQLMESAKWTKFVSVVIFCFAGIMLVGGIFGASTLMYALRNFRQLDANFNMISGIGGGLIAIIIAIFFIAIVLTYYFMFRFATKIKSGIITENVINIDEAFSALKIFFIITTIFSILTILGSLLKFFN